jgi:O-antigen chain-terminating methyltransferase
VSGFHIVEHIPFDDLLELVKESLRVLKPGGLLIMETPNPENIVVGSSSFYLDPTHQQPIPPSLLAFLPEYYGYEKVKIIRLQESIELKNAKHSTLLNVLNGVSPDYAVVARKACHDEKILSATNEAFSVDYGLTLESLTQRYDRQAEARVAEVEVKAQLAHVSAQQAEVRAQQAEVRAQQAEVCARESLVMMQQLLSSSSWRITAPLRMIKINILRLYSAIRDRRVVSGVKRRIHERYCKSKTLDVSVTYSANYLSPRSTQVFKKLQKAIGSREN